MIQFALSQLEFNRKSRFHNKLSTKSGSRWTITFFGQRTVSHPEDDVKDDEGSVIEQDESEFKENIENGKDHWDSYEISSSDDNEGILT